MSCCSSGGSNHVLDRRCFVELCLIPIEPNPFCCALMRNPVLECSRMLPLGLSQGQWIIGNCNKRSGRIWAEGYWANFLHYFPNFSALLKHCLPVEYCLHIWQGSPQLNCGDTCQIWMWFKESNWHFYKIKDFLNGEINVQSFKYFLMEKLINRALHSQELVRLAVNSLNAKFLYHCDFVIILWCTSFNAWLKYDKITEKIVSCIFNFWLGDAHPNHANWFMARVSVYRIPYRNILEKMRGGTWKVTCVKSQFNILWYSLLYSTGTWNRTSLTETLYGKLSLFQL